MDKVHQDASDQDDQCKADRAKKTIIWFMVVFMIIPPLLAWLTGALRF